jgi:ribosomal protein L7/L12
MSYVNEWKLVSTYPLSVDDRAIITKDIENGFIAGNLLCDGQPDNYMDTCIQYLKDGKLLNAVKAYKDATGKGLKESKDAMDELRVSLQMQGII